MKNDKQVAELGRLGREKQVADIQLLIHWDHHANPKTTPEYGRGTNAGQIREYIRSVRPDRMQIHTIGCFGYAAYRSAIAPVVPGLVGDPLATWKQVCEEEGVKLGFYVATYACDHPEGLLHWRERDSDGNPKKQHYCYNSAWTTEYLIPILYELIDRYQPGHFWFDGTWQQGQPCYCDHCRRRFERTYGYPIPVKPTEEQQADIWEMQEASEDDALRLIREALSAKDPDILLAANTAFFSKDLRPPVAVDWLSWDYVNTPNWRTLPFQCAYLATAGRPADVIVYENACVGANPEVQRRRPLAHLRTEAATMLAHGIRFHLWHNPLPDGAIAPKAREIGVELAKFVRERGAWCIDSEPSANVAIFAGRRLHLVVDTRELDWAIQPMHEILRQGHLPCEIVRRDTFLARKERYRVVIVPDTRLMFREDARILKTFVEDGGALVVIGPLPRELALELEMTSQPAGETVARNIGAGRVLHVVRNLVSEFRAVADPDTRDQALRAVREALGNRETIRVNAPTGVEVVPVLQDGSLYVHFVNHVPGRILHETRELLLDEICTVHDVHAEIRIAAEPVRVVLMPGEKPIEYSWKNGWLSVNLPPLGHHVAVRIDQITDRKNAAINGLKSPSGNSTLMLP